MWTLLLLLLLACGGGNTYIVEGIVVEIPGEDVVVIDHKEIPGFMGAMTMPFDVADPAMLRDLVPGHRVVARLDLNGVPGGQLTKLRIIGKGPAPELVDDGPLPLRAKQALPAFEVPTDDGGTMVLGPAQTQRVALGFVYTRCPLPEACPAVVARMQALQEQIGDEARILTITLDPAYDTVEVLHGFAVQSGADPARWQFGRLDEAATEALALQAGLTVIRDNGQILHALRMLVLDPGGRLIERYDDNNWPLDRVVSQLKTGAPPAPPNIQGSVYP